MNVSEIVEFLSALLILIGSITAVISAIGLIRFPDVYTRQHASTKSMTLSVLLTMVGAFFFFLALESHISIRLLLGIVFIFLTAPVSGHLIVRAAYRRKIKTADSTLEDELYDVLHKEEEQDRGE
ncbi:Na+/H+ antiporter subunit G [Lentibacillus sp. CBA3610]|nr:Na+/H+ antiporter subunit G [Lentibacillus sp. CBA3610]QKY70662.1 Na+/H+ antiporter subunit G [Lentibacillus sp. CBA3610]